jgi:hypothetical protein
VTELLCLAEAARKGVDRLRLPIWANKMDHLKIDIINGELGPWGHLYSPINVGVNGKDPVSFIFGVQGVCDIHDRAYEAYAGPLPDSEEYRQVSDAAAALPWSRFES